jgi:hypothetical protein
MAIAVPIMTGQNGNGEQREEDVEDPLGNRIPVGDRPVEDVEHRHGTDVGIGAGTEPELVGVRGEADVERQDPELLQQFRTRIPRSAAAR